MMRPSVYRLSNNRFDEPNNHRLESWLEWPGLASTQLVRRSTWRKWTQEQKDIFLESRNSLRAQQTRMANAVATGASDAASLAGSTIATGVPSQIDAASAARAVAAVAAAAGAAPAAPRAVAPPFAAGRAGAATA